jgi:hypothetical protein
MKIGFITFCISVFVVPLSVFAQSGATFQAQSSQSIGATTTESAALQQGRVLLDSDTNETKESTSADGDPDQPFISGQLYSSSTEMNKADLVEGVMPEPTGIEHEDIGITDDNDTNGDSESGSQTSPSQTKVIILAPSAEDNSNTHDPGITLLENLASLGIDDDEFGFISQEKVYVHSGYLILSDIKGESLDEEQKGNIEITWKVEEGKASKPKEIVVVGSKTADKASPKLLEAVCKGQFATCEPQGAVTPDTLKDFAQRTVNSFASVNEIRMDDSKIEMDGMQPFKLFGLIPMNIKQTISVSVDTDSFARVKVKFPWYSFLGSSTVQQNELQDNLEKGIVATQASKWKAVELDATKFETVPTEQVIFNFSEVKARILQTMSNTLGQYNESDIHFISR